MTLHRTAARRLLTYVAPVLFTVGLVGAGVGSAAYAMDGRNPDARPATAAGEITAQYWHGVNRDPDRAGLDSYLSFAQQNCRWGVLDASFKVLNSAEAHRVWRDNPQTLAGMLYAALLNRPADPGGIAAYTTAIRDRGLAWATAQMMGSAEYRTRLARICPSRSETAMMVDWQTAQDFARDGYLNKAADLAKACAVTSGVKLGLAQLQRTPNPLLMAAGLVAEVTAKVEMLGGLDGTCGAIVTYLRAYREVGRVIAGQQYNPVFIQWTIGSKGWNGQRAFTLRIGTNPTRWTGFSGKVW